ncbi:MAG: rhomboid family intramembrane serine protease [Pseudomonadota bacterium]
MTVKSYDPRDPALANVDARILWWLVGVMAVLEALAQFGGLERELAVYGAFWTLLLGDLDPIFAGQTATMYVTYALLHDGWTHLALNAAVLLAVGRILCLVAGQGLTLLAFLICSSGAALVFAALPGSEGFPLVGASGAVYGFFAIWKRWEWSALRAHGRSTEPVRKFLIVLFAISAAVPLLYPNVAWSAHLGGFLTGWLFAPLLRRR